MGRSMSPSERESRRERRHKRRRSSSSDSERAERKRKRRGSKWGDQPDPSFSAASEAKDPNLARALALAEARLQQAAIGQTIVGTAPGFPANPATKKNREVFVGNLLSGTVQEEDIKNFFRNLFCQLPEFNAKFPDGNPLGEIRMGGDGKYAFAEMRDDVLASTAMKFDKAKLCDRPVTIGRPRDFKESDPPFEPFDVTPLTEKGLIGAGRSPTGDKVAREIYLGNLNGGVTTEMILTAYSHVMNANADPQDRPAISDTRIAGNGNFGFVEFRTPELATLALSALQGIPVGQVFPKLGRPTSYKGADGQPVAPVRNTHHTHHAPPPAAVAPMPMMPMMGGQQMMMMMVPGGPGGVEGAHALMPMPMPMFDPSGAGMPMPVMMMAPPPPPPPAGAP